MILSKSMIFICSYPFRVYAGSSYLLGINQCWNAGTAKVILLEILFLIMTLSIDARNGSTIAMAVPKDDIEISNFRNYVLKIEGNEYVSKNSQDKKLILKIGRNGVLYLDLVGSGTTPVVDFSFIDASVPSGFSHYKTTSAAKAIRGVKGKYRIYKNVDGDFLAFAVGPSGKAYRINLGNLSDGDSKIRRVLDEIPNKSFHKAFFNDKLPQVIIENRQPIKAALDVLEEE